jgi:polysaccharide deacetylase family protein (PEP-CTERM system associated)
VGDSTAPAESRVVLSFDVEEHDRIEAAAGLEIAEDLKAHSRERLRPPTRWILEHLAARGIRATFFVLGQIARHDPGLIREIHGGGHEVASHGWDHRRVHRFDPEGFRADLRRSRDALEQVTGQPVVGYRAPTFSIARRTAWALDVLAEEGMLYDSSIYPVRHDRYGVPAAPRGPFLARGPRRAILELPPATLRIPGCNLPAGGGGYFRLLPLWVTRWAVRQTIRGGGPAVAMLYFHPWEFDPGQRRLPLTGLNRFRTYVGIPRNRARLEALTSRGRFERADEVARSLAAGSAGLQSWDIGGPTRIVDRDPEAGTT